MKGLLDNLENLLPIIVFVVVIVSSWLKKKRQGDFETEPSENDEPLPLPPKRAASGNWEEELRRLLEEEQPVIRPKSTPPPPIVVPPHRPPPLPTPARQSTSLQPVVSPPRTAPAVSMPPAPARLAAPRTVPDEALPAPTRQLAHLTQSARAYDRASHLQEKVEARIAEVGQSHEHYYKGTCHRCRGNIEFPLGAAGTTIACPHCGENTVLAIDRTTPHLRLTGASQRRGASKDARAAVALLRGRQSVRQAMIVSFILGPPKALEGFASNSVVGS